MSYASGVSWRRILFIRTDRLGETILTLPAVLGLRAVLPESEITFLVHPDLCELIQRVGDIQDVWAYSPGSRPFWWYRALQWANTLSKGRFDVVFVSNPMRELHLAVGFSQIPMRVGYNRKWGYWFTHRILDERSNGKRHEVESNLDLIRFAGVSVDDVLPITWNLKSEEKDIIAALVQQGIETSRPFLVIHPWASHPKKEWSPERYVALIRHIRCRYQFPVVMVGQPPRGAFCYDAVLREGSGANLIAKLTLPQLAALLKHARVLVSSDSGPVHLAAAVGTPVIALFGTTDPAAGPARWGPWGSGHKVIWKASMDAITPDEVLEAAASYVR